MSEPTTPIVAEQNGQSQSFDFSDLQPIETTVTIKGKTYVLREASEDAACKYRNQTIRQVRMGPEGRPQSFGDLADAEPALVSACLWETIEIKTKNASITQERNVPIQTVRSWPNRVVKPLFEWIKEHSDLQEKKEDAKNPPKGQSEQPKTTADTSDWPQS